MYEAARQDLTRAYEAVLQQFVQSEYQVLRLLPIAGGIFAGSLPPVMPALTAEALAAACRLLPAPYRRRLAYRSVLMCIYHPAEYEEYLEHFRRWRTEAAPFRACAPARSRRPYRSIL